MADPRLKRAGVSGFNKPKRTPGHKTKSHIVVAKEGDKIKLIVLITTLPYQPSKLLTFYL